MTFFCARNRKKGFFRQFLSSRAKDSVWSVSPSVPVSAVTSASAAARLFPFLPRVRCTIPQDAPASSGTPCSRGLVARIGADSRTLNTQTQSRSRPCASASPPCTMPPASPRQDVDRSVPPPSCSCARCCQSRRPKGRI